MGQPPVTKSALTISSPRWLDIAVDDLFPTSQVFFGDFLVDGLVLVGPGDKETTKTCQQQNQNVVDMSLIHQGLIGGDFYSGLGMWVFVKGHIDILPAPFKLIGNMC